MCFLLLSDNYLLGFWLFLIHSNTQDDVMYFQVSSDNYYNNQPNQSELSAALFLQAAFHCDQNELKRQLDLSNANINVADGHGQTALHSVIEDGNALQGSRNRNTKIELVNFLLGHGADIHAINRDGETPLHLAVYEAEEIISYEIEDFDTAAQIVHLLLEEGVDTTVMNHKGKTALDLAKTDELKELIELKLMEQAFDKVKMIDGSDLSSSRFKP